MISRLFCGFWSLCFLMCAQTFFVTSLRGSDSVPTILALLSGERTKAILANATEDAKGVSDAEGRAVLIDCGALPVTGRRLDRDARYRKKHCAVAWECKTATRRLIT